MTDDEAAIHPPFAGFRMVPERMPDGRTIRYYEWPAAGDDAPGDDPGADDDPEPAP